MTRPTLGEIKTRPITFSGEMVRAILAGRKTQTRRVVNPQPNHIFWDQVKVGKYVGWRDEHGRPRPCPYGASGERLWVREAWRVFDRVDECGHADFPCSCPSHGSPLYKASHDDGESKWKPSIHMPRRMSRILLEVVGVKVRRLHEITADDCIAEGVEFEQLYPREDAGNMVPCDEIRAWNAFISIWEKLNAKRGYPWESNPWVWVIEFKRIDGSEGGPRDAQV